MAETSNSSIDALREMTGAASNSLGLFSDDIDENILSDIDEEALAEVSESHESSERLLVATTVFKQADEAYIQQLVDKNTNKNTKQTTQTWIRRFDAWRAERGISTPPAS